MAEKRERDRRMVLYYSAFSMRLVARIDSNLAARLQAVVARGVVSAA